MLNQNQQSCRPLVNWIGAHDPHLSIPHLQHKNVFFYTKCIIGPLTLSVGDFVLVSNADASDPDSVEGCDVGKILHLYELREMSDRDPYRGVVQWYSRPECIPHKYFDSDEICIDFEKELIEEHRPYDADISLETVYRKCSVIYSTVEESVASILENFKNKSKSCIMFVCRYKFIKIKNSYRLVPLQFESEDIFRHSRKKSMIEEESFPIITSKKLRRSTVFENESAACKQDSTEFGEVKNLNTENKVTPIKIVGGRSVVRLSTKKKVNSNSKLVEQNDHNANYLPVSPLGEQNIKVALRPRISSAKRNLNLSLDNDADDNGMDSECLNYSIVNPKCDPQKNLSDIKIRLRLSERRRSSRLASTNDDPLALYQKGEETACQEMHNKQDIYRTPTKDSKVAKECMALNRRKSILKSATSKLSTPKRSIQLSNVVEKRIFTDNDIINTPKGTNRKKCINYPPNGEANEEISDIDQETPRKYIQKTTPRSRKNMRLENMDGSQISCLKLKMVRSMEIKPTLEKRNVLTDVDENKTDLQIARERLHVSIIPNSLPCREKEFESIYTFLESRIQDQCGGCMYISGVPGTGKTATVTGVIRTLQAKVVEDELLPFDFLEINGMRLTEPRQAYVHIYRQLTGKTLSWEHAHTLLEKRFSSTAPRRITTVLLVDELDILCNRRQDVVYNLLDWPTKSAARLVVVAIANTMDLPERLLMGKVTSRLGLTRLTFQPYSHKQLQEIVTARLNGSETFKSDAVQLVARKVAAVSGDARRALDICRRSTEIADTENETATKIVPTTLQRVSMSHVQQALAEMIASVKVQAIKKCSRLEQIFLQAVVAEVNRTGVEETSFLCVYAQIETIAAFSGIVIPTPGRALRICSKLGAERLIICEHSRNDIFQKILLNVSMDDIHYALKVQN